MGPKLGERAWHGEFLTDSPGIVLVSAPRLAGALKVSSSSVLCRHSGQFACGWAGLDNGPTVRPRKGPVAPCTWQQGPYLP